MSDPMGSMCLCNFGVMVVSHTDAALGCSSAHNSTQYSAPYGNMVQYDSTRVHGFTLVLLQWRYQDDWCFNQYQGDALVLPFLVLCNTLAILSQRTFLAEMSQVCTVWYFSSSVLVGCRMLTWWRGHALPWCAFVKLWHKGKILSALWLGVALLDQQLKWYAIPAVLFLSRFAPWSW